MKIVDIAADVPLVRARSLNRAAKDMGLTQSAITCRVRNLESSLESTLLDSETMPPGTNATGRLADEQCRIVLAEIAAISTWAR